jgi:anti-sigma factor ChrR (cupin superfamily)
MMRQNECLPYEELMADLAAGTLSVEDELRLRAHVEGCKECGRALREFRDAGIAVAASSAVEPPTELGKRLMRRLKSQQSQAFVKLDLGLLLAYPAKLAWEKTGVPGIQRKLLSHNEESGMYTALVHMAAGTRYPAHRHAATEQLFMLSGTLSLAGETIGRGDFCIAQAGTLHTEIHALDDSEFLVMASEHDELHASA